jgi:large subunit ribosomal protein L29
MKQLKTTELTALSDEALTKRLNELRTELSRLRSAAARGTLKKELGEIKTVRRNIARILTSMNSRKRQQLTSDSRVAASSTSPLSKESASEAKIERGGSTE